MSVANLGSFPHMHEAKGGELVPNFVWTLTALLVLAIISSSAAAPEPPSYCLPTTGGLLLSVWESEQQTYASKVFDLVATRVDAYRQSGGSGSVGVYVQEIGSGFEMGYDAERTQLDTKGEYSGYYPTASVAKLLISYAFYSLDDQGEVDIHQTHFDAVTGQTFEIQPMIHRMLTNSINLYHNVLLRYLGSAKACNTLAELGLNSSRLSRELAWAPGTSDAT